jgi:hypothetical protein
MFIARFGTDQTTTLRQRAEVLVQIRRIRGHRFRFGTARGSLVAMATGSADRPGRRALIWALTAFAGYTSVMLGLEQQMRRSGGPGIIAFELAGNATRAQQIMSAWGDDGRRAAHRSMQLDFGYMATYGALTALLINFARRRLGHPAAVCLAVIPAVAGDAVEGVALLNVLAGTNIDENARRARRAAIVKFIVLIAALLYTGGAYLRKPGLPAD